jgi:hypothetical protein
MDIYLYYTITIYTLLYIKMTLEAFSHKGFGFSILKIAVKKRGKDFRRPEDEKNRSILKEYGEKRLQNAIHGCWDWSIFEKEQYNPAVNTATQILIRSYGRQRGLVA